MHTTESKPRKDQGPHYRALVTTADAVGWPERFRTDLTKHDRAFLANRNPQKPFSWILRTDGTALAAPGMIDGAGHRCSEYGRMVAAAFGREHCRFFLWDGLALLEFATPEALDARMLQIETDLGVH